MPKPDCENCPLRDKETGRADPERRCSGVSAIRRPRLRIIADQPKPGQDSGQLPYEVITALKGMGIRRSELSFDYAVACWSTDAKKSEITAAVGHCAPRLTNPDVPTVVMGQHALYAKRGHREFNKWRGANVEGTYVSDSAMAIFANPHLQESLTTHIKHALRPTLPWSNHIVRDGPEMQAALRKLAKAPEIAVDIETAGTDPLTAPMLCIGVGTPELVVSVPWQVDGGKDLWCHPSTATLLREVLANEATKIAHNGSHDFLGLEAAGLAVNGDRFDTLLAHAVVSSERPHGLQYVAGLEFPVEAWKGGFVTSADADLKGSDVYAKRDQYELRHYNAKDVQITAALVEPLRRKISCTHKGNSHYARLNQLSDLCNRMQEKGMPLNEQCREELHERVSAESAKYKAEFESLAGGIDAGKEGSTQAVNDFIFKELKAPVLAKTDTGEPSLKKDVLKRYVNDRQNPTLANVAKVLLKFKMYGKIASTFTGPKCIDVKDNLCHPSWKPWGTVGRRFSCADPNIQQMPFIVREMFRAPPGFVFVEADLSQLEPRIMTDLSGDPKLLEVYRNDLDLYKQVASALFPISYDEVEKAQRQTAKMVWLARAYGIGAESLVEQLASAGNHVSIAGASTFIKRLEQGFPQLARWQKEEIEKAERTGYVEEPYTEWRRHFPDRKVEHPKVRNWPNQAGGAALVNDMLLQLDKEVNWKDEWICGQIHDAITMVVREERADHWIKRLPEIMYMKLPNNGIELISEAKASREWSEVK